jgi:hypothetical protein
MKAQVAGKVRQEFGGTAKGIKNRKKWGDFVTFSPWE